MEELDSTDVNTLRQWFEAKEAAIEADDLMKEREAKLEEEALTPVSESFWIGTIDPDTPVGEGSGLTSQTKWKMLHSRSVSFLLIVSYQL